MEKMTNFDWKRFAQVERWFLHRLKGFEKENAILGKFASDLLALTSTRLLDWVDHILVPGARQTVQELKDLGFQRQPDPAVQVYGHPGVLLPRVVLTGRSSDQKAGLAIRVESLPDFLQKNGFHGDIEGSPFSPYRRALFSPEKGAALYAVERRGGWDLEPTTANSRYLQDYFKAIEMCKNIPRGLDDEAAALAGTMKTVRKIISMLGKDMAAHILCSCERDFWTSRNYAARVQRARQDALGLGWANQDHHTFRSSRRHFSSLVALFSELGFYKRERYYAGKEAGWGAQIMENSRAGLVVFLDVDLDPGEIEIDFTTAVLPEGDNLGTVGLWCALHGDSILKAGMHHLAAQFIFDRHIEDVARYGIKYMAPFSHFSYFKQAFSVAENWKVDADRVESLHAQKVISSKQADTFLGRGAIGSHMENIERREGYKGFNKKNVSTIIKATDPRK